MIINVNQFGQIEFDEQNIYFFENGIIGFENLKKFVLIETEDTLFFWLISIDEPEIIFPLFPVEALLKNYPIPDDYLALGVVSLNREPEKITINLKSPVYISNSKKNGYQTIIDDDQLQINYQLFIKD